MVSDCIQTILSKKYNQRKRQQWSVNGQSMTDETISVEKTFESLVLYLNWKFEQSTNMFIDDSSFSLQNIMNGSTINDEQYMKQYILYSQNKFLLTACCVSLLFTSLKPKNEQFFYGFLLGALSFDEYMKHMGNEWKSHVPYFCGHHISIIKKVFSNLNIFKNDNINDYMIDSSNETKLDMHYTFPDYAFIFTLGSNVSMISNFLFNESKYYIGNLQIQFCLNAFKEHMQTKFYKTHDVEKFLSNMFAYDLKNRKDKKITENQFKDISNINTIVENVSKTQIDKLKIAKQKYELLKNPQQYFEDVSPEENQMNETLLSVETKEVKNKQECCIQVDDCSKKESFVQNKLSSIDQMNEDILERMKKCYTMIIKYVQIVVDILIDRVYYAEQDFSERQRIHNLLIQKIINRITSIACKTRPKRQYSMEELNYAENCALFSLDDGDFHDAWKKKIVKESLEIINQNKSLMNLFGESVNHLNSPKADNESLFDSIQVFEDRQSSEFVKFLNHIVCFIRTYNMLRKHLSFYDYNPRNISYNSVFYNVSSSDLSNKTMFTSYIKGIVTKDNKYIIFPAEI